MCQSSAVVVVVLQVVIMCYCCLQSSSSYENMDLCESSDEHGLCKGSNSNGFCSNQAFDVENAVEFQAQALDSLAASNYFNGGQRTGCINLKTVPPVHTYYCCDRFVDGCGDCYSDAIKRLKEGCAGRNGGNVLFDKCSMRYEIFDFCR